MRLSSDYIRNTKEVMPENDQLEIEEYIMEFIKKNRLKEGSKLPSENELSFRFGVNRNLVRKALDRVKKLGWIYSVKGKGFFVEKKHNTILYPVLSKSCFSENLARTGLAYESRLIKWEKAVPNQEEMRYLELKPGELVYRLEILRIVDGAPLSVYTSALAESRVPGLESHLPCFTSLYNILRNEYGISPVCKAQTIEATYPTKEDIKFLEITEHISILRSASINIHPEGYPVEYCVSRARGDRYKYCLRFNN